MSWWHKAKVGDRVVAIDSTLSHLGNRLVVGVVHTIAEIGDYEKNRYRGCSVFLRLHSPVPEGGGYWSAMCFRPVDPLEKRMEELRGLLDPNRGPWGPREPFNEPEKAPA